MESSGMKLEETGDHPHDLSHSPCPHLSFENVVTAESSSSENHAQKAFLWLVT